MATANDRWRHRSSRTTLAAGATLVLLLVSGCDEAVTPVEDNPRSQVESNEPAAPEPRPQATNPPPPQPREQLAPQQQAPPAQDTTPAKPPPDDHLQEIERQLQEVEEQLNAQRDQMERERRQKAIAEYEAAMAHYLSEIQWLEAAILQMESERVAAYADFEREFGTPFVRFRTNCANAPDFFRCVNASASMPTYELSIDQAKTDIRIYKMAIDALIYPY